jgi:hypothetical protein
MRELDRKVLYREICFMRGTFERFFHNFKIKTQVLRSFEAFGLINLWVLLEFLDLNPIIFLKPKYLFPCPFNYQPLV